jgi:thymidylate kinase
MYETDTLLHPAVYINYHLPFMRLISANLKFKLLSVVFGSRNNSSIFYLDTAPEVAMERIHRRASHINAHENTRDLAKLKKDFEIVHEVAVREGYAIFKIDTNNRSLDEVAREIERIVATKISNWPESYGAVAAK